MSALQRVGLLAPLRHRRYRLLATGTLISLIGDGIFFVALPLLVYGIANVPTALAVVGAVWTTSQVSLLLVGGWASDRYDRRRILIAADVARALAIAGMALLALDGGIELWHVWALGSVVGASNAFFNPALAAIVPDLLPDEDLAGANAFMGVAKPGLQRTIGPALGGLAIGLVGTPGALLFNAGTFLVSAGFLARMGATGDGPRAAPAAGLQRLRLTEGLRFVLAHNWAWAWMVAAALALTAFTGPVDMLLPFVLLNDMGLDQRQAGYALSVVLAFGGIGSMVAATAVGQLDVPRRFLTVMYLVQAVGVAMLAVYGLMTAVWHAVAASFVIGACFAFADVVWMTVLQRFVPRALLGRVSGVDWLTALGLMPLSFAIAGPLAVEFGARQVLVGGAALGFVAVVALLLLVPGARELEERAGGAGHGGAPVEPSSTRPPALSPREDGSHAPGGVLTDGSRAPSGRMDRATDAIG